MKRVIVAAGISIVIAVLAACGTSGGGPNATSTSRPTAPRLTATSTTGTTTRGAGPTASAKPAPSPGTPHRTVVNAANCKPPVQHPYPVVLLPGTYGVTAWQLIGPQLAQLGYCVYTFAYGNGETGDIAKSAQQFARFVDRLLARSSAQRISIVGHSEGGMTPRYYIRFLGEIGRAHV